MTDEREPDPAEEYFELLSKMSNSLEEQRWINIARDAYRINSRYTDAYWDLRERHLREKASGRMMTKIKGGLRKWLKRFSRR